MWLEWRDDRISFIHDYRYVRYVTADAELTLAPEANPADDGALSNVRREYAAGGEFRPARRHCHLHRAHVKSPTPTLCTGAPSASTLRSISTPGAQAR